MPLLGLAVVVEVAVAAGAANESVARVEAVVEADEVAVALAAVVATAAAAVAMAARNEHAVRTTQTGTKGASAHAAHTVEHLCAPPHTPAAVSVRLAAGLFFAHGS